MFQLASFSPLIGAIVGGAAGGVVVLAALITFIFCAMRRKKSRRHTILDLDTESTSMHNPHTTFVMDGNFTSMPYNHSVAPTTTESLDRFTTASLTPHVTSLEYAGPPAPSIRSQTTLVHPRSTHSVAPSQYTTFASTTPASTPGDERTAYSASPPIHSGNTHTHLYSRARSHSDSNSLVSRSEKGPPLPPPRSQTKLSYTPTLASETQAQLTDEQIDFIRGLGSANVPAADIARVIERMKADYAAASASAQRRPSWGAGDGHASVLAPPSYDAGA